MIGVKATECTSGTSNQHPHQRTGVSSNYSTPNHHHSPTANSSARERTMHAVEYYNSNVLKARMGAGLAGPRSSVNERHMSYGARPLNSIGTRLYQNPNADNIYRSNSSLELLDPAEPVSPGGPLRHYGSHGSIDVISSERSPVAQSTSESFFAMLQEYRPAVLGLKKDPSATNVAAVSSNPSDAAQNYRNSALMVEDNVDRGNSSPKLRMKLKLWGPAKTQRSNSHIPTVDDVSSIATNGTTSSTSTTVASADIEERTKRRAFAHYDCQSLTANLGYAAKLRGLLLARRRNTTTGASAAAMFTTRSSTPDGDSADEDYGDGLCNDLTESCPFFRNEIGGEEEREVSLTRLVANGKRPQIHRPTLAYGVSVLECPPNETLWNKNTCPYQKNSRPIEQVDNGAHYYKKYFHGQEHQNWFGMDEQLGPIAISIKKEKPAMQPITSDPTHQQHIFRLIVRTSELLTLRGAVFEDSIPNPRGAGKPINTKEVLEYVAPEVQIGSLRLAQSTPQCETQLLNLDEQGLTSKYKIGIMYCRAGQSTEEEMYNNEEASPAFTEFLDTIGQKVRLKGFESYKGGLDNKTDSTGTHSVYATYQDCEVMFHVSTMLPFTPNNRQQLLRKRHIGNDIVTIVFQEPGALPFTPKHIRSQFQHVFVIVRVVNPCSENAYYRVAVSRSKEVPVFGPPIRQNALYQKGKHFAEFMLAKVINAENAAHRSEKFATMATRTRQEYLKDLCTNYCTQTPVETGQKFSIFPLKKKEPTKPRFSGDASQRGAFCWQVVLHDNGLSSQVDCFLGISSESFVLIEESSRQTVFCVPNRSILGWSTNGNALRVYHHQGECITMGMRDNLESGDEQLEVIERLRNVTNGCGALELSLKRNSMGQLGFHVQPDGVVTQVEINGQAWVAGLRQGYRLVEICKVAVATLSHDQMVDLLKTSAQVTVTVIESHADHSHRRGCFVANCKFIAINYDDDYDLADNSKKINAKKSTSAAQTQAPAAVNNAKRYDRNFSPPRSSNSSGYGTGSSSRSFTAAERFVPDMGTLTSSSSGHSSNDERWYDVIEHPDGTTVKIEHQQNPQSNQHQKVAGANSLPLSQIQEARPIPRQANIEYLASNRQSKVIHDYATPETLLKNLQIQAEDKNNNNRSEPIYSVSMKNLNQQSLDDLNKPPTTMETSQLKRSATTNNIQSAKKTPTAAVAPTSSSSSTSSRNNSPRPLTEAKLRPGVNHRVNANHRASVHYSSTLQEDLLKLINPDYLMGSSDDNFHQGGLSNQMSKQQKNSANSHSLGNLSTAFQTSPLKAAPVLISDDLVLAKKKSRSRENIALTAGLPPSNGHSNLRVHKSNGTSPSDEIITTARPANVISSQSSSSPGIELMQNSKLLHISEEKMKMSPRKQLNGGGLMKHKFPMNDMMKEAEWNNLVDTATRAMLQVNISDK